MLRFKSFQTRILVFFLGLLLAFALATFLLVDIANYNSAKRQIEEGLLVGSRVFSKVMTARAQQLVDAAVLLSGDYALKQAMATNDFETILSVVANHKERVQADFFTIVSLDGRVIADTLHEENRNTPFSLPSVIAEAEEKGESFSIVSIDEKPYQMVVVPLLAPTPIAWICLGFIIDDRLVADIENLTLLNITFALQTSAGQTRIIASTGAGEMRRSVEDFLRSAPPEFMGKSVSANIGGDEYTITSISLEENSSYKVIALLQRSFTKAMEPYNRLRMVLYILGGAGLALSSIAGVFIARTVTKPVKILGDSVRRIDSGDYSHYAVVNQDDELAQLATAINNMARGLMEKDRVRNLLGKVVSHSIAEKLLSKEMELGGEEREVTVLFSDIRGFTARSEDMSPKNLLNVLNSHFTSMNQVIENHNGVVDKYMGDAVMAIFGAPLDMADHPKQAVSAALDMMRAMKELNENLARRALPPLNIGIGVNTDVVVAGNIGSTNRLNYTVIGDGVNLASRLEGANKYYGTTILISENTLRNVEKIFLCRELDKVRVAGKTEAIRVFEVLADREGATQDQLALSNEFGEALRCFRGQDFTAAMSLFKRIDGDTGGDKPSRIYMMRIESIFNAPATAGWDYVYDLPK
ncbi:MAG: HAMP domain-containing protein [Nitrospinae bacterium]|nr:HAMP domain-containing protein [Nitrospinota bacterium]